MPGESIHRFQCDGRRFAIDPESCFCFECDEISWDLLDHYPHVPVNRIYRLLSERHDAKELQEVVGELEWLRATRSILAPPNREKIVKAFEIEHGLRRVTVEWPAAADGSAAEAVAAKRWAFKRTPKREVILPGGARSAAQLLLGRSGTQQELVLEVLVPADRMDEDAIAWQCGDALTMARLAGKNLTVVVHVPDVGANAASGPLAGHVVGAKLELRGSAHGADAIRAFAKSVGQSLSRLSKAIQPDVPDVTGRIALRPGHAQFGDAIKVLDEAGFRLIEFDLDAAFIAQPTLDPAAVVRSLCQCAAYYAGRLLHHHYFRVDPIAPLFWRIYAGSALPRSDPAGTNELAVDAAGDIYPSRLFFGIQEFRLGRISDGAIDETLVRRFEDVGSVTTSPCMTCWARHLCGGGTAAVHHALTGSFRTPSEPWCDAQRAWMEAAVGAFQQLSSHGVPFERVYKALGKAGKPSLFTLARAWLTMSIGVRPIEERDARLLTQWENWSESAYFAFNETGTLLATQYDREMDALHPKGVDHELLLVQKNGTPIGLLKLRPSRLPGAADAWVYLHDAADYASETIRKGFRAILKEAASSQESIRLLTVPVSPKEDALAAFLEAVGFRKAGILREALYLHGAYHDVTAYRIDTQAL